MEAKIFLSEKLCILFLCAVFLQDAAIQYATLKLVLNRNL